MQSTFTRVQIFENFCATAGKGAKESADNMTANLIDSAMLVYLKDDKYSIVNKYS